MTPEASQNIVFDSNLPGWLKQISLTKALNETVGDVFSKLLGIRIENASKEGENYSSLLIRIIAEVEIKNGDAKCISFILKTTQANEMMAQILDMFRIFPKEEELYYRIIPRFEQLYRDAGKNLKFAPKAFKMDVDINKDYILLEDLSDKSYKNANRIQGLDLHHMEAVLRKMAEYHAASACYVECYGGYSEDFTVGVFSEKNASILGQFNKSTAFLMQLKKWPNCTAYYEKLANSDDYLVKRLLEDQRVNTGEFNVLNHGDCWSNNIMFQYDAFGKIKDTLFIDFALGKYGSPANDLYYFILSSSAADIKLSKFDYFIRYYYDYLIENLKLLNYSRPLPKLSGIHGSLYRNGLAAYMIVTKVLPATILDKSDEANLENYTNEKSKMVCSMYNNPKYITQMMEILPWLDNRGLLDWK
uniref:Putative ecdysteroid kinase n=1 Tax=Haematobia irritans TaxID=7368 RepID=A0A1L8EFZ7_HAEIR